MKPTVTSEDSLHEAESKGDQRESRGLGEPSSGANVWAYLDPKGRDL